MKILTVDDDDSFVELIERSLSASDNHQVVKALSGAEAMTILQTHEDAFDCLLFDIQMPELDGITLCRHVRTDPRYATTPVIMLTAMSQSHYLDNAFAAGASDYLNKPFDFQVLREKLRSWQRTDIAHYKPAGGVDAFGQPVERTITSSDIDLAARLEALDLPRLVEYIAFENFVLKRAQQAGKRFCVTALKISNFERLQEDLSPPDLTRVISAFARVLSAGMHKLDAMFSYRGRGIFLIACPGFARFLKSRLHVALHKAISQLDRADAAAQARIHYVLGSPSRVKTPDDAIFALYQAVKSVESLNIARSLDTVPARQLGNLYFNDELAHLEARGYRALFNDDIRASDGNWPPARMLVPKG